MSLDTLIAARKQLLAEREAKTKPQRTCHRCGKPAKWLTETEGTAICDPCERKQLAADGRLPPGIRGED